MVNKAIASEAFPNAGPALNRGIQMTCGSVQKRGGRLAMLALDAKEPQVPQQGLGTLKMALRLFWGLARTGERARSHEWRKKVKGIGESTKIQRKI
jgi:hypothetical protein